MPLRTLTLPLDYYYYYYYCANHASIDPKFVVYQMGYIKLHKKRATQSSINQLVWRRWVSITYIFNSWKKSHQSSACSLLLFVKSLFICASIYTVMKNIFKFTNIHSINIEIKFLLYRLSTRLTWFFKKLYKKLKI